MQNYNIYINEKALIITSVLKEGTKDAQIIDVQSFDFCKFYYEISSLTENIFYLVSEDPERAFETLKSKVKNIEAAGGLVKNPDNGYLFIKRLGKWDLPKGKLEPNEKIEEAAVREVEEECGVTVTRLGHKIVETYHMYNIKEQVILKTTYWYAMEVDSEQSLTPQLEEDITEAVWIKKPDWNQVTANTYPSIITVLELA